MTAALLALFGGLLFALALSWRRERRAHQSTLRALERERSAREREIGEQAAAQERERIYHDLHDDLGAKLLGLIHGATTPQQADQARALLQDLRDTVSRSRGTPGTLGDVLADIRSEARQRLAAAQMELNWVESGELPDPPLRSEQSLHLHRIVREAISNAIRHAQAASLRVRVACRGNELRLELTDDGHRRVGEGRGTQGMRQRAQELDGDIRWTEGTAGGTKVVLVFPLPAAAG
ncbi:histidine kinase/DNA gyrase B/HSP90-like ATPase [Tahibacter aquaticus]|uniref:histidine kinase n=1 Tax=Tahibacter aquaticus TaxID=520092 RepID=A0A4R6YV80_9GAMM|nr:ATP-binding protein [Tahibacter aquaticus]TDR42540.1 histidine kinase/DNA gyrase B/HSP90-like ATPase [Tahibacter aquaticus]